MVDGVPVPSKITEERGILFPLHREGRLQSALLLDINEVRSSNEGNNIALPKLKHPGGSRRKQ